MIYIYILYIYIMYLIFVVFTGSEDPCLFLVDAREHFACIIPSDAGVYIVFISGWKLSACASRIVAPVERRLVSETAGRHPVPYHEICQRSRTWCCVPGSSEDPGCSCSFSNVRGTSAALFPPMLVDFGTGGIPLRISDRYRSKFRYIRLGRMTVCVQKSKDVFSVT